MTILRLRDNRFGDKGLQFKKHAEASQETATDTNFVSVASGDGNIEARKIFGLLNTTRTMQDFASIQVI